MIFLTSDQLFYKMKHINFYQLKRGNREMKIFRSPFFSYSRIRFNKSITLLPIVFVEKNRFQKGKPPANVEYTK